MSGCAGNRSTDAALLAAATVAAFNQKVGPAPGSASPNGTQPLLLINADSSHADTDGVVVKMRDSTWSDTSPYGSGQAFILLSSSSTAASDTSNDGVPGSNTNPVLFRVSSDGGVGCGGVHVAPGIRQNQTGAVPSQGIWVQQFSLDAAGIVLSGPNPTYVPAPTLPFLIAESWAGTPYADISAGGAIRTFADNGTTAVSAVYPKDTAAAGYRAIYLTQTPATAGVGIKLAASQTAAALVVNNSSAVMLSGIDSAGSVVTRDDGGSSSALALYAKTTPASGYRAIFNTVSAGTAGVGIHAATSQSAPLLALTNAAAATMAGFDAAGNGFWQNDAGTATLAQVNAGTTPASGFRASFGAGSVGTVPLIAQAAVSTTVDMFQVKSGSGLVLQRVSSAGHWLQATSTAPTLAEMIDNEWTGRVSGSTIILYARVSGVLKSVTLTVT